MIQTADEDAARINALMARHVAEQHVSVAAQHAKTLTKCLAAFRLIEAGGKFTKFDARSLSAEVSGLLGVPFAPGEKENAIPVSITASPVGAGTNGADSHVSDVGEVVPSNDADSARIQPVDADGHPQS
jgi:hypothetical protein